MIGHDNKFIQFNTREVFGDIKPIYYCNYAIFIQNHFIINDFSEQASFVFRAYRHKIGAILRIIVFLQTDGPSVMYIRIVFHKILFRDSHQTDYTVRIS